MLPRVTSGVTGRLKGSLVASGGNGWHQGSGVTLGVTDGLVGLQMALWGLQMASGAGGSFVGSWVAMGGRW
jgi:hypothetical protein